MLARLQKTEWNPPTPSRPPALAAAGLDPATDRLPQGWERRLDTASGKPYFVDHVNKKTHWSIPPYLLQRAGAADAAATADAATANTAPYLQQGGAASELQMGDRCEARYNKGTPERVERSFAWYPGTVKQVSQVNQGHVLGVNTLSTVLYDVLYDDGVFERGIPKQFVRRETGGEDVLPGVGGPDIPAPADNRAPYLRHGGATSASGAAATGDGGRGERGKGVAGARSNVDEHEFSRARSLRSLRHFCPADAPAAQQHALSLAECVVCFGHLHTETAGVFTQAGARVCPHFLHYRCAEDWRVSARGDAQCPVCRRSFDAVLEVPKITEDASAWFDVADLSGEGTLQRREVLEALKAQLPIDFVRLEAELEREGPDSLWGQWDMNGDNSISKHEFLAPEHGLLAHILREFYSDGSARCTEVPDIKREKNAWFDYWDYDGNGTLEQGEIVRALIKTFELSDDANRVAQVADVVEAVWGIFDTDGSGEIDREEFVERDGLADSIIASMDMRR